MIPLGGLIELRNATLEDQTWRKGGGADPIGSTLGASEQIQQATDYWPTTGQQRTVVWTDAGKLYKDDGNGGGWTTLLTGLTVAGAVPFLLKAAAEQVGNNRKCLYFDGLNAPLVLDGDGATFQTFAAAGGGLSADWTGTNQPSCAVVHQGYCWAFGNKNSPHRAYRSTLTSHITFNSSPYSLPVFSGEGERLVAGLSYKGVLLLWKYPEGVYAIDTSDPSDTNWRVVKVGQPGAAGPRNVVQIEDDVMWVAPDGSWHLISATTATGSVRAEDLTARKLGSYFRDQVNLARLDTSQLDYYSHKQEVILACHASGQTAKNRRIHMDLNKRSEIGERWIWWDVDRNESLFMRKKNEIHIPAFGDEQGRIWEADKVGRSRNGAGYAFSWFLKPSDYSEVIPGWQGRKKNLRFLQIEYDARSAATHSVDVYADGNLRQTIDFSLTGSGATLPAVLPFTLGTNTLLTTARRRLRGQGVRFAFRGRSATNDEDVSISRVLVGLELGE